MIDRGELIRLLREFISRAGEIADPEDYQKAADLAERLARGEPVYKGVEDTLLVRVSRALADLHEWHHRPGAEAVVRLNPFEASGLDKIAGCRVIADGRVAPGSAVVGFEGE